MIEGSLYASGSAMTNTSNYLHPHGAFALKAVRVREGWVAQVTLFGEIILEHLAHAETEFEAIEEVRVLFGQAMSYLLHEIATEEADD